MMYSHLWRETQLPSFWSTKDQPLLTTWCSGCTGAFMPWWHWVWWHWCLGFVCPVHVLTANSVRDGEFFPWHDESTGRKALICNVGELHLPGSSNINISSRQSPSLQEPGTLFLTFSWSTASMWGFVFNPSHKLAKNSGKSFVAYCGLSRYLIIRYLFTILYNLLGLDSRY